MKLDLYGRDSRTGIIYVTCRYYNNINVFLLGMLYSKKNIIYLNVTVCSRLYMLAVINYAISRVWLIIVFSHARFRRSWKKLEQVQSVVMKEVAIVKCCGRRYQLVHGC